jgi:hypothetical protein
MTSFVVPEGIRRISTGSFYPVNALTEITFPTTLEAIDEQVFWLSPLKKITFKSAVPPSLKEDLLYGSTPDAIYVYPEYYNTYKTNVMHLIAPFITPIKLYNEGYVRIIKDGAFVVADETNVVTVGGLSVTQDNDYMKYVSVDNVSDINVRLNDTIVGQIAGQYTTIYVGDNSSLISGDGMNFRYGVNNETVKAELNANGWFYDPRFEGIRSMKSDDTYVSSEITLSLPAYANTNTPVVFGMYSYLDSETAKKVYGYFKDSNDNILLKN